MARPTSATIHVDALRHNLGQVRARAPRSRVMAVVKADGYGHGLERVARALACADAFGVAALSDAERLRAAGISQPILLLSGFDEPGDIPRLRELNVWTTIHHASQLEMLEQAAPGEPLDCWLKLDSGMHRLGFAPEAFGDAHARLSAMRLADCKVEPRGAAWRGLRPHPQGPSCRRRRRRHRSVACGRTLPRSSLPATPAGRARPMPIALTDPGPRAQARRESPAGLVA